MVTRRFNPLDPLGLFERESNPPQASQAEINKFLADVRKKMADEAEAQREYTRMANEAERLGFRRQARTLLSMAGDESRHRLDLQDMTITTW